VDKDATIGRIYKYINSDSDQVGSLLPDVFDSLEKRQIIKTKKLLSSNKSANEIYSIINDRNNTLSEYKKCIIIGAFLCELGLITIDGYPLIKKESKKKLYNKIYKYLPVKESN